MRAQKEKKTGKKFYCSYFSMFFSLNNSQTFHHFLSSVFFCFNGRDENETKIFKKQHTTPIIIINTSSHLYFRQKKDAKMWENKEKAAGKKGKKHKTIKGKKEEPQIFNAKTEPL